MKVIFSHGKESGPWGNKISQLADIATEMGFSVESIDYRDLAAPERRVERLKETLANSQQALLLVGSSMGGYVSLVAAQSHPVAGVFLLAPAVYMPGYEVQNYAAKVPVEVVHGWDDSVIAVENAFRFAKQTAATLHLLAGDHRLNSSMDKITPLFKQFLSNYRL